MVILMNGKARISVRVKMWFWSVHGGSRRAAISPFVPYDEDSARCTIGQHGQ